MWNQCGIMYHHQGHAPRIVSLLFGSCTNAFRVMHQRYQGQSPRFTGHAPRIPRIVSSFYGSCTKDIIPDFSSKFAPFSAPQARNLTLLQLNFHMQIHAKACNLTLLLLNLHMQIDASCPTTTTTVSTTYMPQFLSLSLEIGNIRPSRYWAETFFGDFAKVIFHFRNFILEHFQEFQRCQSCSFGAMNVKFEI